MLVTKFISLTLLQYVQFFTFLFHYKIIIFTHAILSLLPGLRVSDILYTGLKIFAEVSFGFIRHVTWHEYSW